MFIYKTLYSEILEVGGRWQKNTPYKSYPNRDISTHRLSKWQLAYESKLIRFLVDGFIWITM